MTNRKKHRDDWPNLFNLPLEPKKDTSVQEIKKDITEHLWLVFDSIWLNERKSRINLWDEEFNAVIVWVCNDEAGYEKYSPIKDAIFSYLSVRFPYAKSAAPLVFEILYCYPKDGENVPLCFDKRGNLDIGKIFSTYSYSEIKDFLGKIHAGAPELQRFKIWEEELSLYWKQWYCPTPEKNIVSGASTKKANKEQRRMLDDTFPIPKQSPWLPYIHIENGQLAIKYMIGLYGKRSIIETFEKIEQQIRPYNLPRLQDALNKLSKSFHNASPQTIVFGLCWNYGDKNVVATREWKWRLTMRLKNFLDEQKLPDIKYGEGYDDRWMIVHLPTWVVREKEFLFNFRPHEREKELLRWAEERKKYTEYMDRLEVLLKDTPVEWAFIIRDQEALWWRFGDKKSEKPLPLSSIFHLDEDQWIAKIQARIYEPPKELKVTPPEIVEEAPVEELEISSSDIQGVEKNNLETEEVIPPPGDEDVPPEKEEGVLEIPEIIENVGPEENVPFPIEENPDLEEDFTFERKNIILDQSSLDIIYKRCPEIFFNEEGKFDLERMKIEYDFGTIMNVFEKILSRRYPYNHEYLYQTTNQLLQQQWWEDLQYIIDHEEPLLDLFIAIFKELKEISILQRLEEKWPWKSVEFWMIRIALGMDYIRNWSDENHVRDDDDEKNFEEWFDILFRGEVTREGHDRYRQHIMNIVKQQNPETTALIKSCPNIINLYISYFNEGWNNSPVVAQQKNIIREHLLSIDIPERYKIYTSKTQDKYLWDTWLCSCTTKESLIQTITEYWPRSVISALKYKSDSDEIVQTFSRISGIDQDMQELEKRQEQLIAFFDNVAWTIRKYEFWMNLATWRAISDNYRSTLQEWFDLITYGLLYKRDHDMYNEEEFEASYIEEFGENALNKKDAVVEIVQLKGANGHHTFHKFFCNLKYLPHMLTSYLKKQHWENISQVYRRNAIADYITSLAPKHSSMNYRKKSLPSITQTLSLPQSFLTTSKNIKENRLFEEFTRFFYGLDDVEEINIDEGNRLLCHMSWVNISASKIYLKPKDQRHSAIQDFLNNEVLIAQLNTPSPDIHNLPLTKTQQLGPILDECKDDMNKLIEYTDKLSKLSIEISWKGKEITDTDTWATISFDELLEDWPEDLKMNLLMWLSDIRGERNEDKEEGIKPPVSKKSWPLDNDYVLDDDDDDGSDDLPF